MKTRKHIIAPLALVACLALPTGPLRAAIVIQDGFSGSFVAGNGAIMGRTPDTRNVPGYTYTESQNNSSGSLANMELDTSTGSPGNSLRTGFNNSLQIQISNALVPPKYVRISVDAQINTLLDDSLVRGIGVGYYDPVPTVFPGTIADTTTGFTGLVVNPAGTLEYVLGGISQGTFGTTAPVGFSTSAFLTLDYQVDTSSGSFRSVSYGGTDYTANFAAVDDFTPSNYFGAFGTTSTSAFNFGRLDNLEIEILAVPEPSTLGLLGIGMVLLRRLRRRLNPAAA